MSDNQPSREWLLKMADAEDKCQSVSVGGLAHDMGWLREQARHSTYCLIPAEISSGGFSSERHFEITLANGNAFTGIAYQKYVSESNGQYYLACYIVRESDGVALVSLPSGDVVEVKASALLEIKL